MARSDFTVFNLIARVHAPMLRCADAYLFDAGSSWLEQWLLEEIPHDGRASASELAQRLEVPTSTVTRALRRMERWGYVELSKGHVLDVRVLRSRCTALGADVRETGRGFEKQIDSILLRRVRPSVLPGLVQGLRDIRAELDTLHVGDRETLAQEISSGSAT